MELSGPSFVIVKNGRLLKKYEVIARSCSPKGIQTTAYYFNKKRDAELYYQYLNQIEGEKSLNNLINSDRTFKWEKKEYQDFKDSIDWNELPSKIKKIKFTSETTFTEVRKKK